MGKKQCARCGVTQTIDNFYKRKWPNGRVTQPSPCYSCKKEELKKYRRIEGSYANRRRRFSRKKRIAKKRGLDYNLTQKEFERIRKEKYCFYCGEETDVKTIDRVDNRNGYSAENCVMACHRCNTIKRDLLKKDIPVLKKILTTLEDL